MKRRAQPRLLIIAGWTAILVSVALHILAFVGTPIFQELPHNLPEERDVFVVYPAAQRSAYHRLLAEQAWLLDTTPIFLPTPWSYAPKPEYLTQAVEATGFLFDDSEPHITLKAGPLPNETLLPSPPIRRSMQVLLRDFWNFFTGFGEKAQHISPLPQRTGHCRIVSLNSGCHVHESLLPEILGLRLSMPPLNPVTFLVYINNGDILGSPLLLKASGSDAVDRILREFTEQDLLPSINLEPGYYQIIIGP